MRVQKLVSFRKILGTVGLPSWKEFSDECQET